MLEYDINNGLIPRKKTEHRERNETVLRRNGLQENSKKKKTIVLIYRQYYIIILNLDFKFFQLIR